MWKSRDGEHDRSGQPEQNSWNSLERVDPHRGEHLLGRTAHSARNEETNHDRTGLWEVTQQNLSVKSGTKCQFDKKECQPMQRIVPNIRYYGECLWLQH